MNTQEVKGTLAKLLATENLTVEHRKVSTAAFDVEKRLLILPIWKTLLTPSMTFWWGMKSVMHSTPPTKTLALLLSLL